MFDHSDVAIDPLVSEPARHVSARAPQPGTPFRDPSDTNGHIVDYLRILHKRRWIAATVFIVTFVAMIADAFTAIPLYDARTRLLIDAENPNVIEFKEVVGENPSRVDYYQTQYNLLRSRSVARRTVESVGFRGEASPALSARLSSMASKTAVRALAFVWTPASAETAPTPEPVPEAVAAPVPVESAIDALLSGLTVTPVANSRLVDVTFRGADPELAGRVVNAHAQSYIEQNLDFRFHASKEANDWLSRQLAEQRTRVEESEIALQRYREHNDAISSEDRQNIVVQKLVDLNAAVTRAKTERIEKEAVYQQAAAAQQETAALDAFPSMLSNAYMQQLKGDLAALYRQQAELAQRLGDKHPDMIKVRTAIQQAEVKFQAETAKVVQSFRNAFLAAKAQEASLMAALDAQKREALALNRKGIEYGVLERDVESNRQIYESLLQRAKETGVSTALRTSNIRIVDAAETPRHPASPNKRRTALNGVGAGLVLAICIAFFFEYVDNRIKQPEEIRLRLGIPFLGILPVVSTKGRQAPLMGRDGVPPEFGEAVRVVRTNVLYASPHDGARTLLVTSTRPGEGKTLVATNLAVAFAASGRRVLLIDADMRRPDVHPRFNVPREPGLSDVVVRTVQVTTAQRHAGIKGLWVLPAGRTAPNPAELLSSERFDRLLADAKENFDIILIDSPPVLAVADAPILASKCSAVLFVIGAEMTNGKAARTALDQLVPANARILGAVLNRVDLNRQAYYYSDYYRREYSRYYQAG
jgi:succinoglycan biosynthesis transport protein ExoP